MHFEAIQIFRFRNYKEAVFQVPQGVVVFFGENAQGKTNLIEALYYLIRGESFRPVEKGALFTSTVEREEQHTFIKAKLNKNESIYDLSLSFLDHRKKFLLNGKASSPVKNSEIFPTILFSPESLMAIKSGPELRRSLLDDLLKSEGGPSARVLREFGRSLKTRNRILKDFKNGHSDRPRTERLLESLDGIYLPLATEVVLKRLEWLSELIPEMNRAFRSILKEENVEISVEYVISEQNALTWKRDQIITAMHQRTLDLRGAELESGRSLVGPHKHDMNFFLGEKNARFFCSQGQQRALILAFKMAQIMVHYQRHRVYPLLFLDDVLSELDSEKRTNLIRFLREIPSQIFLTTTDLSFSAEFGQRTLSMFKIEQGQIETAGV